MKTLNILIIDDDKVIQDSCSLILKKEGYKVQVAGDGEKGLLAFKKELFHVILLDLKMPRMDGMQVLAKIKEESPETPVIIITGYASIGSAVEAMKQGAFEYLTKPFTPEELRISINKALKSRKVFFESIYLRDELKKKTEFDMVVGKSKAMEKVLDIVRRVSPSDSTVLIKS